MKILTLAMIFFVFAATLISCGTSTKDKKRIKHNNHITSVIKKHSKSFGKCVDRKLLKNHVVINLSFTIVPTGEVSETRVETETESVPKNSLKCIDGKLKKLKFKPSSDGEKISVYQPIRIFPSR